MFEISARTYSKIFHSSFIIQLLFFTRVYKKDSLRFLSYLIHVYIFVKEKRKKKEERAYKNGSTRYIRLSVDKNPSSSPLLPSSRLEHRVNYRQVEFLAPKFFNRPRLPTISARKGRISGYSRLTPFFPPRIYGASRCRA